MSARERQCAQQDEATGVRLKVREGQVRIEGRKEVGWVGGNPNPKG